MQPYAVIDLHCDTLTRIPAQGHSVLNDPTAAFALSKLPCGVHWGQCCAIFLPDGLSAQQGWALYQRARDNFARELRRFDPILAPCRRGGDIERAWRMGKAAALLTVENGSVLAGELGRVDQLKRDGVCILTLTWNGENALGSGKDTEHGLTPFGRAAVRRLEARGILPDVSHLNPQGFSDVLQAAGKPFLATHSNAKAVCPHPRNLADWQIQEMIRRKCLIGLNYYSPFLRGDGQAATRDDLFAHVEHFLELGGEDVLALGSDFDGADAPPGLDSPEQVAGLYEFFQRRGLSAALTEKIMHGNAFTFFRENLR